MLKTKRKLITQVIRSIIRVIENEKGVLTGLLAAILAAGCATGATGNGIDVSITNFDAEMKRIKTQKYEGRELTFRGNLRDEYGSWVGYYEAVIEKDGKVRVKKYEGGKVSFIHY